MADKPDPQSVANHEASHAVAWWWWVNRPDGVDDGTGGRFEQVGLTPDQRIRHGAFNPGEHLVSRGDQNAADHFCIGLFAGPISDELRGEVRDEETTDEIRARIHYVRIMQKDLDVVETERLRTTTRDFLMRPDVQAMVEALQEQIMGYGSVSFEDAVETLKVAGAVSD